MNLINRLTHGISNLLKPTYNIREIIPGWNDDYPEPMFTDEWELSSELDLNDNSIYDGYFNTNVMREYHRLTNRDNQSIENCFTSEIGEYNWSEQTIDIDQELYDHTEYDIDYLASYSQDDENYLTRIDNGTFTGFNNEENKYLELVSGCYGCKYFHGQQHGGVDFICSIHPEGNKNCADFEAGN